MPTNADRAAWAETSIDVFAHETFHRAFQDLPEGDQEDCISDLVCDLMHLAKSMGFDPETVNHRAQMNFEAEIGEEEEAD